VTRLYLQSLYNISTTCECELFRTVSRCFSAANEHDARFSSPARYGIVAPHAAEHNMQGLLLAIDQLLEGSRQALSRSSSVRLFTMFVKIVTFENTHFILQYLISDFFNINSNYSSYSKHSKSMK
jgi:hypothetical protein